MSLFSEIVQPYLTARMVIPGSLTLDIWISGVPAENVFVKVVGCGLPTDRGPPTAGGMAQKIFFPQFSFLFVLQKRENGVGHVLE